MRSELVLENGETFSGAAFGWDGSVAGEVVFNTGMVGYPETLTDPSYRGQILVLTYPLVGNYGVPQQSSTEIEQLADFFESNRIHISALIVSEYSEEYSHWAGETSLSEWLKEYRIPAISGVDTRKLTQILRTRGSMLGKVVSGEENVSFQDPNERNLVSEVSISEPIEIGKGKKKVVVIDCGCKNNIVRSLLKRKVAVKVVPWDHPVHKETCDGVIISNGPGDPLQCEETIKTLEKLYKKKTPIFGICLGSQLMALAAGAKTYKLKYGHRSQNQPCVMVQSKRCFITSQNHGYAVEEKSLPSSWEPWFFNANDGTNEGIRHIKKPFMGVQFHPEAHPGPVDTNFLFDDFVNML